MKPAAALLSVALFAVAVPAFAVHFLTEENPPFNFAVGAKISGSSAAVVQEMAKRAGVEANFELLPWDTAYRRAPIEKDTCIFSIARLQERERLFQWIGPLASNKWTAYGLASGAPAIKSESDLRRYKIGGVKNDAKVDFLMDHGVTNIVRADRDADNPPKLFLKKDDPNRIDLWVTSAYGAPRTADAAKVKMTDLKIVYPLGEEPLYLACSPQTAKDIVQKLDKAFNDMQADGTLKKISDPFFK